jgi:hypothetical protein
MRIPPELYVFCIWIWVLTFVYWFDFTSFSPVYLSAIALQFSIVFNLFYTNNSLLWSLFIVAGETAILFINIYKHFIIDKKMIIEPNDIVISVVIFGFYLLFLRLINKSFYQVYFVDLKRRSWHELRYPPTRQTRAFIPPITM